MEEKETTTKTCNGTENGGATMLKAGTETGSLFNHLYSGMKNSPSPEVGMGATVLMWTDRLAGTIINVTPKSFTVQEDKATRVDKNGMSECQEYTYEPNPKGQVFVFRMTKKGYRSGSRGVVVGLRVQYHDYSF